jgi:hypothetical protein
LRSGPRRIEDGHHSLFTLEEVELDSGEMVLLVDLVEHGLDVGLCERRLQAQDCSSPVAAGLRGRQDRLSSAPKPFSLRACAGTFARECALRQSWEMRRLRHLGSSRSFCHQDTERRATPHRGNSANERGLTEERSRDRSSFSSLEVLVASSDWATPI